MRVRMQRVGELTRARSYTWDVVLVFSVYLEGKWHTRAIERSFATSRAADSWYNWAINRPEYERREFEI